MSESTFSRVYHPSLPGSFQDVKSSEVESWSKAGWLKTKPKGFDDSEALPVGEAFHATLEQEPVDGPAQEKPEKG